MFQSNKPNKSSSSILSADVEVYGDLKVSGSMLVYGKVFGSVESPRVGICLSHSIFPNESVFIAQIK